MKSSLTLKIIISAIVCLAIGGLSGFATAGSIDGWYETINKPFFNPPNWVFGPVWTILYALMGVSSVIIWSKGLDQKAVKKALIVFGIHLVLNGLWSILFFGLQQPAWAFVEIIVLLISIFYFTNLFYKITPIAGWLQVPYILWVSFASLLNGLDLNFYYGSSESQMIQIGETQNMNVVSFELSDGFNGPYVGMYASSSGMDSSTKASFDWFEYDGE